MSFKYTPATLRKLETLFEAAAYTVRYEKGTFQSGSCLLEDRKVVVVNRFLPPEGRINALLEILPSVRIDPAALDPESAKLYQQATAARPLPESPQTASAS